jgi:DNA (cytosine-5)-methyltransferase 1
LINIATVFSGVGTPEWTLKQMDKEYNTVFACEIDKYARTTYLENLEEPETFYEDITKLDATKYLGKIDLLVGGFPCQNFSISGNRTGLEGTTGTLFYDLARVIKECQPKVFVVENVKGLLSHDKGNTWKVVQDTFKELGYNIVSKVVNTRDYGVPQNRERVYIIGTLTENNFVFPEGYELKLCINDILEKDVDPKYLLNHKQVTARESSNYNTRRQSLSEGDTYVGILCARDYKEPKVINVTHVYNVNTHESRKRICDVEGCSPTLTTASGGYHEVKISHNKIFRKLTPREYFRLQGFSDDFKFPEKMSNTQLYKQAGNGMSVNMLEMIFTALYEQGYLTE